MPEHLQMGGSLLGALTFECKDVHSTADPAIRKLAFCVKRQKYWDQCSMLGSKDKKALGDSIQGHFPMDLNAEQVEILLQPMLQMMTSKRNMEEDPWEKLDIFPNNYFKS
ncbi:unnamed protein product [Trifolium pratense]|uniref:Uncharacterized protein n=1 Tax=Trifolium pratense TaxID=57577 RepID=A0ACB0IB79_TRIPR|nr:unnamed protein product [Trifolium pratense]